MTMTLARGILNHLSGKVETYAGQQAGCGNLQNIAQALSWWFNLIQFHYYMYTVYD